MLLEHKTAAPSLAAVLVFLFALIDWCIAVGQIDFYLPICQTNVDSKLYEGKVRAKKISLSEYR